MARIAGVDLPRTKRVEIGLTYIFGIKRVRSNKILKDAGVGPDLRVKDLSEDDVRKISRVIEEQGGVEGADQRAHAQGPAQGRDCQQEEDRVVVVRSRTRILYA